MSAAKLLPKSDCLGTEEAQARSRQRPDPALVAEAHEVFGKPTKESVKHQLISMGYSEDEAQKLASSYS